MKFNVNQTIFNKALQNLVRNTSEKFACYHGILIEKHSNDMLKLSATNGNTRMFYKIPAMDVEGDKILVNARKLTEIVARLNGVIHFDENILKCGKSKIKIDLENVDEFISFNDIEITNLETVNTQDFKNALRGRLYACDKNSGVLSGVNINKNKVAATNGNLLSVCELGKDLIEKPVTISNALAFEIVKTFDSDEIVIGLTNNTMLVKNDNVTIIGNILLNKFPNYEALLPTQKYNVNLDKTLIISRLELLNATVDIDIDKYVIFDFNKDELLIKSKNGDSEIEIDYDGEPTKIAFNINLLLSALKNIDSDVVNFKFTLPLSPVTIKAGNELTLIMPMQLRSIDK